MANWTFALIRDFHRPRAEPLRIFESKIALIMMLLLPLLLTCQTRAQLYTGSIAGTVTDPSGAVVAGVQVKATDEAKGFNFTATTDSAGRYVIRQLPPADYTVTASASGFTTERKTGIKIDVNQNAGVDFALKVGGAAEIVDVTAGAVQLQTEDAVTGQVIDRTFLNNLPLVGR